MAYFAIHVGASAAGLSVLGARATYAMVSTNKLLAITAQEHTNVFRYAGDKRAGRTTDTKCPSKYVNRYCTR